MASPVKIESAGVILGGVRTSLEINSTRWAAISDKAAAAFVPSVIYNGYPLADLNVWSKPLGTPTLDLYMWGEFTSFTNYKYNDLAIDATNANQVTSAGRPFTAADIGNFINVANQVAGFTPGRYAINSVASGQGDSVGEGRHHGHYGGIATYGMTADFPPCLKAIRYNLAVDLEPDFAVGGSHLNELTSGSPVDRSAVTGATTIGNDTNPAFVILNGARLGLASAGVFYVDTGNGPGGDRLHPWTRELDAGDDRQGHLDIIGDDWPRPSVVQQAAEVLQDAGWGRDLSTELGAFGERRCNRYEVNPEVWE
jgi:hypothetical protein